MDVTRKKIFLVDDIVANLDQGRNMLKSTYSTYPAQSAEKLFELLENVTPDLILLDINMPVMNGYEAIKKLKADNRYADIPVIFHTAKADDESELEGFDLGAVDYVSKPFSAPLLAKRIETHLLISQQKKDLLDNQVMLQDYANNLADLVQEKTEEVLELQNAVLAAVADLAEFRDKSTGEHINRTKHFFRRLLNQLIDDNVYTDEVSVWDVDLLLQSAQLHDVGKIAISDLILNKPGILTKEEFEIMKTHVALGVDVIERVIKNTRKHAFLDQALVITETHHEKWDGTGYPKGLKGYDIPLQGRLMAIVDVYDALISDRPYKKAFPHDVAKKIMLESSGTHFDPVLVEAFVRAENEFVNLAQEQASIA